MKFKYEYFDEKKADDYFGVAYFVKDAPNAKGDRDKVETDYTKKPLFFFTAADGKSDLRLPSNMRYMFLPNRKHGSRDIIYACGKSGGGKSFLMDAFAVLYHRLFPANKILFFSKNDFKGDVSLTHDIYKPIPIEPFIEELEKTDYAEGHQFKNTLLVMDDIGVLRNDKRQEKVLWQFIDAALENMRKKNVSIYIISHVPTNYRQTALLVREVHHYVVYPKAQQVSSDRMLRNYLGLNARAVSRIVDEPLSRWVDVDCANKLITCDNRISTIDFCGQK